MSDGGDELSRLLRTTSRTFSLGIELLRAPLREQVRAAYLVLRVSDYLEDNRVMTGAEKVRLLSLWHEALHGRDVLAELESGLQGVAGQDPIPDLEAARRAGVILTALDALDDRARRAIAAHAGRSTLGMARWVRRGPRFDDEADLDDYMHEVAGRVGYLLTDLFALRSPGIRRRRERLTPLGREFGLALQTVNVIRGLSSDRHRGWVFVPRSFLPGDVEPERLFEPAHRDAAMEALDALSAKASRHFEAAGRYLALLPRRNARVRLFCMLPFFFGVKTLAVSRRNPRVLDAEVKIARRDVRAIVRWATLFGPSDRWVRWYARRLASAAAETP